MEETQTTPSPVTERQRPGRLLARIVRVTSREKGYIFARLLQTDEECFLHKSGIPLALWSNLERGQAITCRVSETSKGLRGYDVAAGDPDDQARVTVEEENWGNRG